MSRFSLFTVLGILSCISTCCLLSSVRVTVAAEGAGSGVEAQSPAGTDEALGRLREKIRRDSRLDGVLLTDAYYNDNQELAFVGRRWQYDTVASGEKQIEQLKETINEERRTHWASSRDATGINLDDVIPVPHLPKRVQAIVARRPEYDGIRIDRHFYEDDGTLCLKGIQGREKQQLSLADLIRTELQPTSDWQDVLGSRWKLDLDFVSIGDFLSQAQALIADTPELDGTRIDRIYFDRRGRLTFRGIRWDTSRTASAVPGESEGEGDEKSVSALLRDQLFEMVARDWPRFISGGELNLETLSVVHDPIPNMRQLVSGDGRLDGVRIDRAYYDADRKLTVTGIQDQVREGESPQSELLRNVFEAELSSEDEWQLWQGEGVALPQLRPLDFSKVCTTIQLALASKRLPDGTLPDKVRIDRVFYDQDNLLRFEGIRWNELDTSDQEPDHDLRTVVHDALRPWRETIYGDHPDLFSLEDIVSRGSALSYVRRLIAGDHKLGGLRIDTAFYDGDGSLRFTGAKSKRNQEELLNETLQDTVSQTQAWRDWTKKGWQIDPLAVVPLDDLLARIQERVIQDGSFDGTRIDRLFYDADLRLALEGQRWPGTSGDQLARLVVDVVCSDCPKAIRNSDGSAAAESVAPPAGKLLDRISLSAVREHESFVDHLRQLVADDPSLDGVRLDRAYYDTDGVLQILGIIGTDDHMSHLLGLVAARKSSEERWDCQLTNGCSVSRMRRMSIAPWVQFAQQVIPAYETLDGASVTRLYYAPDGRLAIQGRVQNEQQRRELQRVLAMEFTKLPNSHVRLQSPRMSSSRGDNDELLDVEEVVVDPITFAPSRSRAKCHEGQSLVWKGRYDEALDRLNVALKLDPKNALAWCYRALCHIVNGDVDLARRDIRRVLQMERRGVVREGCHYRGFERVQGPHRLQFERLRLEVLVNRFSNTEKGR